MPELNLSDIDYYAFIEPNYMKKSVEELLKISTENKFAAYELGRRYRRKNDIKNAYKYFEIASNLKNLRAPYELGLILHEQKKFKKAAKFFELSINAIDDEESHLILGKYYITGLIGGFFKGERDKEGFKHLIIAAKRGNPEAQFLTALCYSDGIGIGKSRFDYILWLRCSQLNGFPEAINRIIAMRQPQYNLLWKELWEKNINAVDEEISKHQKEYIMIYLRELVRKQMDNE